MTVRKAHTSTSGTPLPANQFRDSVERALAHRPLKTPLGTVLPGTQDVHLGSPSGSHQIPPAWVYVREDARLHMFFQFYKNFTGHDLICKVMETGQSPRSGEGGSVQFNSNRCMLPEPPNVALWHHGQVTVISAVSRDRLVAAMMEACPSAATMAGIPMMASHWPHRIGSTSDIPALIDDMFLYAYCVEQAKLHMRGSAPLPQLPP